MFSFSGPGQLVSRGTRVHSGAGRLAVSGGQRLASGHVHGQFVCGERVFESVRPGRGGQIRLVRRFSQRVRLTRIRLPVRPARDGKLLLA